MKRIKRAALAMVMLITLMAVNSDMVLAAQEIQGSDATSQAVEVTAEVKSMYSVSMPASIELTFSEISRVYIDGIYTSSATEGYWGTIVYGCAGKISNNEYVYIEPVFPCTLVGMEYGKAIALRKILPSSKEEPKSTWSAEEIGTCNYDGVSLTNCKYAYCKGLQIGFKKSDVVSYDVYKGTLIFNFGIAGN